jgi:hypothetical protein
LEGLPSRQERVKKMIESIEEKHPPSSKQHNRSFLETSTLLSISQYVNRTKSQTPEEKMVSEPVMKV